MRPSWALVELAGFAAVAVVLAWVSFVLVITLLDDAAVRALIAE